MHTSSDDHFFKPGKLLRDFLRELRLRGAPKFGDRRWMIALEIAESLDVMRAVKARNDALWPDPRPVVVHYLEDDDPHRLIYLGLTIAPAQPAEEFDAARHAGSLENDRNYRERHKEQLADYNRSYRQGKGRENFLSWQRAYREKNNDRINRLRRIKRQAAAISP